MEQKVTRKGGRKQENNCRLSKEAEGREEKLLAAGNLGEFNMNDMDEQLRQLEGAYTDREEDYAEEEEEYDELIEEVLRENIAEQSSMD